MSECTHDCSTCGESCAERQSEPAVTLNKLSKVNKVIAVMSGKGGVGKSMVTSLLASAVQSKGYNAAILDADVTGPSIPQAFGVHSKAYGDENGILPVFAKNGTQIMSINLLLADETDPVVWRGPVIAGAVTQFWTDVVWSDVNYMFVDMPPGTGDVPLTVLQSLPVDGIVVVTSPQELVEMIVGKAVKMAKLLNVPILGFVENMSYFVCPSCGQKHSIFGESRVDEFAHNSGVDCVCKLPIDPSLAHLCDEGKIYTADVSALDELVEKIIALPDKKQE